MPSSAVRDHDPAAAATPVRTAPSRSARLGDWASWGPWTPWIAAAAALAVRAADLGQSLWADELYTLRVAQMPWHDVAAHADQTPPLHALLLHGWIALFGASEAAVRWPSALASAGAAGVAVVVARRWLPDGGALLAGLLVAVHPILVGQGREARAYALLLLLGTIGWWLWLKVRDGLAQDPDAARGAWGRRPPGRRMRTYAWLAAYTAVACATLYTHVFGAFFLAGHAIAGLLLVPRLPWRSWSLVTLSQAVAALSFLPWFGTLLDRASYVSEGFWIEPSGWESLGGTALFLGGTWAIAAHVAAWAVVLWLRPRVPQAFWVLGATWTLAAILLPYLASFAVPVYTPRYAMPAAVGYLLLVAGFVWAVPRQRLRQGLAIALVGAGLAASLPLAGLDTELSRQDWRGVAAFLDDHAAPGDAVLFLPGYCDSDATDDLSCAWGHYGQRTDLDLVPVGDPNVGIGDGTEAQVRARLDGHDAVWLVDATDPADPGDPADPDGPAPTVKGWLAGFQAGEERSFARIQVTRYARS